MHMGGDTTAAAVAEMLPALERRGYIMVTIGELIGLTRDGADFGGRVVYVQSGDTLFQIAGCFNTTVPILASANQIANPNQIVVGQRLYVPLRDEVTIQVDGVKLNLAPAAQIVNGRSMGPVRAITEALGATVQWDGTTQKVTITRGGAIIEMTIGSTTAIVNGFPRTLDVAPFLQESRTQAPVRFIAEHLGAVVSWDHDSRTANITGQ
jgi:LysM repeat protein